MLLFLRNGERFHLENTSFTLGYITWLNKLFVLSTIGKYVDIVSLNSIQLQGKE